MNVKYGGGLTNTNGYIQIICSPAVDLFWDPKEHLNFTLPANDTVETGHVTFNKTLFSTSDKNCPIEELKFSDTSKEDPISFLGCDITEYGGPVNNENCRFLGFPFHKV
jgi:hypothetical protein